MKFLSSYISYLRTRFLFFLLLKESLFFNLSYKIFFIFKQTNIFVYAFKAPLTSGIYFGI